MDRTMPEWASDLINYGPLGIFAIAVCFAVWRMATFAGHKLFDDDKGLVPKWVDSELQWRNRLTERLAEQQKTCVTHNEMLGGMAKLVADQVSIGVIAKDNAIMAAQAASSANHTLTNIDTTLMTRTKMLQETGDDVASLKAAALKACEMCRQVAAVECPTSAVVIEQHTREIERIIGEA
jgi:hypothetical protein